jgi:diapolycopene oxygenase
LSQPQAPPARRYRRLEPSSSGLVFLWGLAESYPELGVNNIFFSADYRREFRELFEERVCPRNPTIYVNVTSKLTPQDAPRGAENWFVLVNAPYLSGQDWKQETRRVRQRILSVMERVLGRPVGRSIVVEQVMTPEDIQRNTGSTRGSLYGISSNSPLAAFLRHPNRSRRIRGLYFCGGSVHPGGGMPLAVLSGKIAADLVKKHEE